MFISTPIDSPISTLTWCPFHRRFPLRAFRSIRWAAEVWDLEAPRLLLSIVGGAGEMNLDPAVEAHFCEELVGAAKQTHGWVITGGTDSGVMDLVGRAMHRHDARRTVPCIGVTPFGALKDAWRATLDPVEAGRRVAKERVTSHRWIHPL
ncbi:unnamed protein product [Durusdinium trenchii]|uniref:TRPM SLOG domain-containing protein n=1 Tax=Durusdinium trenchii TaxID=1381693 RepID=A0ABP0MXA0_9DINO